MTKLLLMTPISEDNFKVQQYEGNKAGEIFELNLSGCEFDVKLKAVEEVRLFEAIPEQPIPPPIECPIIQNVVRNISNDPSYTPVQIDDCRPAAEAGAEL